MDQDVIIDQLEELAERFDIQIRYEPIKQDEDLVKIVGGLCLLRGQYVLIIDSRAAMIDKINTFAEALRHFDLGRIYIKPVIRELLDKVPASVRPRPYS
ncbi:Uncharacterised protein [uncultured archaeon]|nr:Uncharacterised protein [uncultured archaeon]